MNFNKAEFYTSYGLFKQIPKSEKAEIAFSGRSNVGKSSLINKILNRKFALPTERLYSAFVYYPLDVEKMQMAAAYLVVSTLISLVSVEKRDLL